MDTNNNLQLVQIEQEEQHSSNVKFVDLVRRCAKNWYWFLISLLVFGSLATLRILTTQPMYRRTAVILIKESATRRLATSDLESMLSGSSGQVSSKVVNEVIAFSSPALIRDVVTRLGLCTEYASVGLFRNTMLYGNQSPVKVDFIDIPSNCSAYFDIKPEAGENFSISNVTYKIAADKFKVAETFKGAAGDTLQLPFGTICVTRSQYFQQEWNNVISVSRKNINAVTASFLARSGAASVDVKNKSDVIELSVLDPSPQRADDFLNTLISIYNENWVSDKNKMAVSTSVFINERLSALQKELGDVDENISSYKSQNLIPDINAMSETYVTQSRENDRMIQQLESDLYFYRFLQTYLINHPGVEELIPAVGGVSSSSLNTQISNFNDMLLTRNNLASGTSSSNPIVADLTEGLKSVRAAIETTVANQIETASMQVDELKSKESSINTRIAQSPTQAKYLLTVGREQKVKETLYLYLLQKREENELSQAFAAYNTRVITPPMGAVVKASPSLLKTFGIALFLGFFLPFFVIYFKLIFDTKVRSKKDLESVSLPFLGEIPQYDSSSRKGLARFFSEAKDANEIVVKEGSRDVINESFRVLRTNLEFMLKGIDSPVILFTSFNPGSGKTFLSSNIATVLSIKRHKVLVIDGDMRHASLSEYVDSPKKGLSNYLAGDFENYQDLVHQVGDNTYLHILPVGTIPPNPSELIGNARFRELVANAKKEYDYVFIDCPPIDIVADTQIISDIADRTVFVTRAGVLEKAFVSSINQLETSKNLRNVCVVLNGTSSYEHGYGSYHHYGYYGSSYHYYSSK